VVVVLVEVMLVVARLVLVGAVLLLQQVQRTLVEVAVEETLVLTLLAVLAVRVS
jgi:hypothetical protein